MFRILDDITKGNGRPGDIELLLELSEAIKRSSICGLGKTAPNPVLTTLRYFRDEYEAHILEKRCPAGVCMVYEERSLMEKVAIKIDDKDILVKKNATILETALSNNIYIPHLCYHPDLRPAGSCRLCLVEMDNGQLVTSCGTPVKEGMIIKNKKFLI